MEPLCQRNPFIFEVLVGIHSLVVADLGVGRLPVCGRNPTAWSPHDGDGVANLVAVLPVNIEVN
jgi:hypothetical protein